NEVVSTAEDTPITGSVLEGTSSVEGDVTVVSFSVAGDNSTYNAGDSVTIAGIGVLILNTDGSYSFTPALNYNGPVPVITYLLTDGLSPDTSTLTISVTPETDPFVDANEVVSTAEDTPITGSVLEGTSSVEGGVTVVSFSVAGDNSTYNAGDSVTIAGIGVLILNTDGSYSFTPA
ncbi:cadherin-like domain-containing protein, partial [Shewanella gelidii]|uniref:cadherin-like domain-containing protein n=1 Tax=Shewanella gelidii TaxID=1642821 RepID=UPI00188CBB89